ncbi:MAG: beta-phosphoglucomutase [Eubacteriales bacterium]|nr:beta-phosphoglucomutase [Eubacteriales bacterium]
MKYEGVIFDLDGVLCHTDAFHYQAWKQAAEEAGIYFDEKINDRLRGVSRMECMEIILEKDPERMTEKQKRDFADRKNGIYRKLLKNMGPEDVSEDVSFTLMYLKSAGIKLAVGSSSKNAGYILERLGLDDLFDQVTDGNDIRNSKPDPEVFLKAAEGLGLLPKQCLVVEDARAGVDAAAAGGFECAGIGDAAAYRKTTWSLKRVSDILML